MPLKLFKFNEEIINLYNCSSTNDIAKYLISENEGRIILSLSQSKGRGRRENVWISKPGGLYFSFILKPDFIPSVNQHLSRLTGEVVKDVVMQYLPDSVITYKEPNDILVNNKKIAGILIETSTTGEKNNYIIVGIGINIFNNIPDVGTSFLKENLINIQRKEILDSFLSVFTNKYNNFLKKNHSWQKGQ